MFCPEATTQMRVDALLGQAELAKKMNNRSWRTSVARSAETLQFHSREWIDHHLSPLPRSAPAPSAMPAGPTRDIRLDVDPTIQRRVEDAAAADEPMEMEVSPEEEERLLKEDSPPIQDYDLSSLPGPDISGCPVSCSGAVIGWVQVYYRSAGVGLFYSILSHNLGRSSGHHR